MPHFYSPHKMPLCLLLCFGPEADYLFSYCCVSRSESKKQLTLSVAAVTKVQHFFNKNNSAAKARKESAFSGNCNEQHSSGAQISQEGLNLLYLSRSMFWLIELHGHIEREEEENFILHSFAGKKHLCTSFQSKLLW